MSRKLPRLTLAGLLAVLSAALPAEEVCMKRVFNEYCLGGDMDAQVRAPKPVIHQQREGDRFAVVYADGDGSAYVMSFKGRIYKVLRRYDPSTILRFNDLEKILTGKYGPPNDLSRYPAYARNRASRIGAIRRGEGRAELVWEPRGEPWAVTLAWNRELGLHLYYTAKELDAQMEMAAESGL
ncbi:MAG: hypothetical protein PVF91_03145 [Chromatiales bacterium]|jgi:hypothetical protein